MIQNFFQDNRLSMPGMSDKTNDTGLEVCAINSEFIYPHSVFRNGTVFCILLKNHQFQFQAF